MSYKASLLLLSVSFLIIISSTANAQQAGLNFTVAIPQGEFADQIDNLGYGLSGEFMLLSPNIQKPFGFGLDIAYYIYGSETRREPWSFYIPDAFVDVSRTNNLVNFHIVFELGLPSGRIKPYIQGLFGGSYLYTQTSVNGEYSGESITSTINYDDWAWSYGLGGGVAILLSGDPVTEDGAIYLDLKGKYLLGSEATYLKEGAVEISAGQVRYYPSNSKTDIISIHAGVRIALNFNSDN